MNNSEPTLKVRLWLETGEGMLLGLGRARLLAEVDRHGSLNKAAQQMGMSYRAAWGRLKKTEELIGAPLVDRKGNRKGFVLTPLARELVRLFNIWHDDVERYALERALQIFPWHVHGFAEAKASEPNHEDKRST